MAETDAIILGSGGWRPRGGKQPGLSALLAHRHRRVRVHAMFTPQPYAGYVGTPRRTDNGPGGQVPSAGGSSFLFPQSATAPRT